MTRCNHDPLYTTDGRCSKCYPPKHVIMIRHADGMIEVDDAPRPAFVPVAVITALDLEPVADEHRPGYIPHGAAALPDMVRLADEKVHAFYTSQHDERGTGCAGNSGDEYDSASEGRW